MFLLAAANSYRPALRRGAAAGNTGAQRLSLSELAFGRAIGIETAFFNRWKDNPVKRRGKVRPNRQDYLNRSSSQIDDVYLFRETKSLRIFCA
jgi:hypothetical protein